MLVFKGARLRVCTVKKKGNEGHLECISELPPHHALLQAKKEIASVDFFNFLEWKNWFVNDTADLRKNGGRILLLYDAYHSHVSIPVLEKVCLNGIIGYALPSHTSGTTVPLKLSLFPSFQQYCQTVARGIGVEQTLDEFDMCKIITAAYEQSFSFSNTISGFRATGLCLLDEYRLFA